MRCIALCLSVAVLIGWAFPASAQSDVHNTKIVSGPGGGPFDDACRPGDVLVGFNYISGKAMNRLAGVCQAQNNGVLVGANYGLATHGEDPGNGTLLGAEFHGEGFPRCPPGQAIYEMRVWLDRHNEVEKVAASCTPLLPDPHVQGVYLGDWGGGGEAVRSEPFSCGPADIAIGIIGRAGSQIDGVGLKCGTFPWRPVATRGATAGDAAAGDTAADKPNIREGHRRCADLSPACAASRHSVEGRSGGSHRSGGAKKSRGPSISQLVRIELAQQSGG